MYRFFVLMAVAALMLVGCGGGDNPGPGNTGGGGSTPECSASNCAGCCFNKVCQTGTTASACGKGGATCVACGSSQVCKTDQTCGVDPDSVWRVQPISAQIASSNNGTAWDGDGSPPDVFVQMQCPGASTSTSTAEVESYSPTWTTGGCTAKASQLLAQQWAFQVWDSDVFSDDTITGVLGFQFTEAHLKAGSVTFSASGGMTSLTVQLQKQP